MSESLRYADGFSAPARIVSFVRLRLPTGVHRSLANDRYPSTEAVRGARTLLD